MIPDGIRSTVSGVAPAKAALARVTTVTAAVILVVTAAACGVGTPAAAPVPSATVAEPNPSEQTSAGQTPTAVAGDITVFAAASLTESFTQIGKDFQVANPGARVVLSFAGSSALATQVNEGAPADVFAAASPVTMRTVTDAGNGDGEPVTFVRNQLVIAVAHGNPKGLHGLRDLTRPGTKVALCAEQVPCGAAARRSLDAATVPLVPVTLEQDVKAALAKVRLGEVDAALVYRTDVRPAESDVDGIEFPESASAVNDYPIVVLADAPNKAGAVAFLAFVRSDKGMTVLTRAGFQVP